MQPEDIITELRTYAANLVKKEHEFRLSYLESKQANIDPNLAWNYIALEQSAVWMSLYSHINLLGHFKFRKTKRVDKKIPKWLRDAFGWPNEVAKPFWCCGRNPIAHTGNHSLPDSEIVDGAERFIVLSFDDPNNWPGAGDEYMALPQTTPTGRPMPIQQTTFFFTPIKDRLTELADDICSDIGGYEYEQLNELYDTLMSLSLLADDGSLAAIGNRLDVYRHVTNI